MVSRGRTFAGATRPLWVMVMAGTLILFTAPAPSQAQGSCSVPATSAGSPFAGGVQTLSPGAGWAELTVFHLDTRSHYLFNGEVSNFFAEGRLVVTSVITNVAVGVLDGVELRGQLPLHVLSYGEVSGSRERTGFGDPRVEVRLGPQLLGMSPERLPVDLAMKGGVKLPVEEFPVSSQIIPLTEGQRDWELAMELGGSVADGRLAVQGWAGYRWRETNTSIHRRPANERFAFLSVGGPLGPMGWSVGTQWLAGGPHQVMGIRVPSTRRRILEFFPAVGVPVGPGWANVGARLPAAGRNLPAGTAFSFSYSLGWGAGEGG